MQNASLSQDLWLSWLSFIDSLPDFCEIILKDTLSKNINLGSDAKLIGIYYVFFSFP